MAKKKSLLGTLLFLSAAAAGTAAVYSKRKEIRAMLRNAAERFLPEEDAEEFECEEPGDAGIDITIDRSRRTGAEQALEDVVAAEEQAAEATADAEETPAE